MNNKWTASAWMLTALVCWALPSFAAAAVQVQHSGQSIKISTPKLRIEYDLKRGVWEVAWTGFSAASPTLRGANCAAKLSDGRVLTASDYPEHQCLAADITPISDAFGRGTQILVHHHAPGSPELRQCFRIYPNLPYFFLRLEIVSPVPIASNDISPLLCDEARQPDAGLRLDAGDKLQTLFVPYDNDQYVRYNSEAASKSYEATAVYDNSGRHGFVLGSVSHDLWKTVITMGRPVGRALNALRVEGGAADRQTRDTQPHGPVSGRNVASPLILVGCFSDWRAGLEAYGRANARLNPPLPWSGGVPFGWNSWAAYQDHVDAKRCLAVSDFLKRSLQGQGFENRGTLYVNLDSYWDNLTEAQIIEAVQHIHSNGQKAGIYWTPFVCWGGDLHRPVEGGGRYTYEDILLKAADGSPLPKLDGGLPLDPTHPGVLQRIDWQLERFVRWGFDYVKLDFLSHGAMEGAHFDPNVATGVAAYNIGMKRIVADLAPHRIGRPFFISLSIAPLFPAGYGHSRRISCDTWDEIGNTEYMLNSATYGWWACGALYRYNDPDHTVLCRIFQGRPHTTEAEARSRLNASVIAGGILLNSDDLTQAQSQERAVKLLSNAEINTLARSGRTFRPVEGDTGDHAADLFVCTDAAPHRYYIAVFNYNSMKSIVMTLEPGRLGLDPAVSYRVRDLWTKKATTARGGFSLELSPASSTILCLTPEK